MKISEFENTEWGAGMLAIINYNMLEIISVDFSTNENMRFCIMVNLFFFFSVLLNWLIIKIEKIL